MINTSNEFKEVVKGQDRQFYSGATITLSDSTVLTLDNSRIMSKKIEDMTSQSGSFNIGSAIVNRLVMSINNYDDEYSDYDFTDAVIRPTVGLQLSETIETLNKGVFNSDSPKFKSSVITLTALDNMAKFDKPFSGVTQVFPCTAQDLLNTVCSYCGVILGTSTFDHDDYVIQSRPADEATNCREVVSWIAQLGCNFARCNTSGALEIKWYDTGVFEEETNLDGGKFDDTDEESYQSGDSADGGNFDNYASGDTFDGGTFDIFSRYHHLYTAMATPNIATDDVIITGIQVTDSSETPNKVLFGSTGYVIAIEKNDLIQSQSDANAVANFIGAKLVGVRFRPMSLSVRSDPSIEAGDVAYVSTRKGTYQILLSNVSYGIGQFTRISCDAESPARNSSARYSESTKTYVKARETTEKHISDYDLLVQQMTMLIAGGYGMYQTSITDESGGTIYYLHDKKTMAESAVRWFTTSEGMIEQNQVGGVWVTVSGVDKQGNALYNTLTARKISADIVRTGKIYSNDGSTLIDMAFGVANSDNFSFIDNIQSGFPLTMPFNIDDSVSKINKVLLKFTQQKFRTYSDTVSSGGGSFQSSSTNGTNIATTIMAGGGYTDSYGSVSADSTTGNTLATAGNYHYHSLSNTHNHHYDISHAHGVVDNGHSHTVSISSHTHDLNFGIKEQVISNNEITVYVDGVLRATTSLLQGILDLTAYVTTSGWHAIEVRSTTLKRISAQINIKSYIRS
jgi:hypothetical protein